MSFWFRVFPGCAISSCFQKLLKTLRPRQLKRSQQRATPSNYFNCYNINTDVLNTQNYNSSYAALERKAELYEKLVRGELSDEEDSFYLGRLCYQNRWKKEKPIRNTMNVYYLYLGGS
ncbi:hypothetical protein ACP275_08G130700 [Erythranthe tilingii]